MNLVVSPNPCGIRGIAFVEFAAHTSTGLRKLFRDFGFSAVAAHRTMQSTLFVQHEIRFLLTTDPASFAHRFATQHGPCISALGLRVRDPEQAFSTALDRGAQPFVPSEQDGEGTINYPAVYGIGSSLIYFVHDPTSSLGEDFEPVARPEVVPSKGFLAIDHLTNNVAKGTLHQWADFYKSIFGFTEVRSFDIRGESTGLYSFALRSPDGSFCIPINEGTESKSQIEEYLREYKGPGIQHLAFLTNDLVASLDAMKGSSVAFLDIDDDYYAEVFDRVPGVTEDRTKLHHHQILVDGDEAGYLLQIFTKNIIGPIFFELIQRRNHLSFGEGNFGALFRSIERDQERRGVL